MKKLISLTAFAVLFFALQTAVAQELPSGQRTGIRQKSPAAGASTDPAAGGAAGTKGVGLPNGQRQNKLAVSSAGGAGADAARVRASARPRNYPNASGAEANGGPGAGGKDKPGKNKSGKAAIGGEKLEAGDEKIKR